MDKENPKKDKLVPVLMFIESLCNHYCLESLLLKGHL